MNHFSSGNKKGALPSQLLGELIKAGFIENAKVKNIAQASLDLSVSDEIYSVEGIFQPTVHENVRDILSQVRTKTHDINAPLRKDTMYLARLNERMKLPQSLYGFCNPKSTSGRNDIHVRVLADKVPRYDSIPAGYHGELWMAIMPKSFSIKIGEGQTLAQIRLFNAETKLTDLEIEIAMRYNKLLWNYREERPLQYGELLIRDNDNSLILTIDLLCDVVGYEGRETKAVLDMSKVGGNNPNLFFQKMTKKGDHVLLKKNHFYILTTLESVRIPPDMACEMVSMDDKSGEFRSHYAGYIDPGWGWGEKGEGIGRPLTLEVRPFEDIIVRQGQPIAKIKLERMVESPHVAYDMAQSNYLKQWGPKLSKHFGSWEKK